MVMICRGEASVGHQLHLPVLEIAWRRGGPVSVPNPHLTPESAIEIFCHFEPIPAVRVVRFGGHAFLKLGIFERAEHRGRN
jgi:hypothetical protein